MNKFLFSLVLLLSTFACTATTSVSSSVIQKAHSASYQIHQSVMHGSATCSATAIGPQALLTATHCELPTDILLIRDADRPAIVMGRLRDDQDHTIYLLKNVTFKDYVNVDLSNKLEQGTDVFIFGNPGDLQDVYRRGYVAGRRTEGGGFLELFTGEKPETIILFDMADYHGDSGAGIYAEDGKLVGVVSLIVSESDKDDPGVYMNLTGAYALDFTQSQLDSARSYSVANDPEEDEGHGK